MPGSRLPEPYIGKDVEAATPDHMKERTLYLAVPEAAWSLAVLLRVRLLGPGASRPPVRERLRPSLESSRPCVVSPRVP